MFKVRSSTEEIDLSTDIVGRASPAVAAIHRKCGVYTRPEIVEEILDGVGWTAHADLSKATLLEPAAGDGAFVAVAATRLILSMRLHGYPLKLAALVDRIQAFEIHPGVACRAQKRIIQVLRGLSIPPRTCKVLAHSWIVISDFLVTPLSEKSFSHVVGNPPYARWSKIPKLLRRRYERLLPKRMTKGDLFLPFLDLSIGYLAPGARLGFVCSDRWRYMAFAETFRRERLPEIVVERERHLGSANAYCREVSVYPSVLLLRRRIRVTAKQHLGTMKPSPSLSDAAYSIRVGPALGWTPAYVLAPDEQDVELLAPWIDGADIQEGGILWKGRRVIALHNEKGVLHRLNNYPRVASRLRKHRDRLKDRAIVRAGATWYRPIDRVIAAGWARPKLVIPELAKTPRVAIDYSGSIPSHGVYAIFAPNDEVEKLYEILRDGGLARALEGIAPKVNGGYVRCYRRFLQQIVI